MTYAQTVTLQPNAIWNAFIGAFEGGSTSWIHSANLVSSEFAPADPKLVWWGDEKLYTGDFSFEVTYDDPDEDEGAGNGRKVLTRADVQTGLGILACKYPHHFAALMSETDDADTHDALMQCIVLGDIVYG